MSEAHGRRGLAGLSDLSRIGQPAKGKNRNEEKCADCFFRASIRSPVSHAQGLGSILGRVTDPAGAGVAGAQVTATQEGTGFSRAATHGYRWALRSPSLRPAVYNLTVEAKGFSTSKQSGITLLADQTLTVNMALKLVPSPKSSPSPQHRSSGHLHSHAQASDRAAAHCRIASERQECRATHLARRRRRQLPQRRSRPGRH